jgi:hypothetical protein
MLADHDRLARVERAGAGARNRVCDREVGRAEGAELGGGTRMSRVLLVYVAGPYRAPTAWGVERNIQRARDLGALVAQAGAYPVIPHSNTSHFDGLAPDALWLDGTIELLRRCDAVIVVDCWEQSSGTRAELAEANDRRLPVFFELADLRAWIEANA